MGKVHPRRILNGRCPVCNRDMGDAFIYRDSDSNEYTRGRWGVTTDNYLCPDCNASIEVEFELAKPIIRVNGEELSNGKSL